MNVLFLTTGRMSSIETHALYPDLLRQFRNHGHNVYVVSQREKRTGLPTELIEETGAHLLQVRTGNITKCGRIEKGISTLTIEGHYKRAIKKYFKGIRFDLVLYSTPPITLAGVVKHVKKRDKAKTYLMLKDIFPQNAVDLSMMTKSGIKGLLYRYFRHKEAALYAISDYIGCMSPANARYVLAHNPKVDPGKVGLCPNAIEVQDLSLTAGERAVMREKYGIPRDKTVFVYGGNLGKPQGIPFIIDCLKAQRENPDAFFLIVGDGTEYKKLEAFFDDEKPRNMKLIPRLPKEDYDRMVAACDVGMIFLDHRFTIPNFPSRLLAYMQAGLPVLACTDKNTDVGQVITEGGFGWWCESNSTEDFSRTVTEALTANRATMAKNATNYLNENYAVSHCYGMITKHI